MGERGEGGPGREEDEVKFRGGLSGSNRDSCENRKKGGGREDGNMATVKAASFGSASTGFQRTMRFSLFFLN